MSKRNDYNRFFYPSKSPSTKVDILTGQILELPKNFKSPGVIVWPSRQKGTYVRTKHGELKS